MSKVKGDYDAHKKSKLRRSLRRYEENKIKESRFKMCRRNNRWWTGVGYIIKDDRAVTHTEYEEIPEHKESVKKITAYVEKQSVWYDEDGYAHRGMRYSIPVYSFETIVVPKKKVIKTRYWEYLPIKPYLKRYHTSKKFCKREAAKAARKVTLKNGSSYKKAYNFRNILW